MRTSEFDDHGFGRRSRPARRAVAILALVLIVAMSGCTSGGHVATTQSALTVGKHLSVLIIPPPSGYAIDASSGAVGAISPAVFDQFGGAHSAAQDGFQGGFKQNYVDSQTDEGITITVIQFSSGSMASAFLERTRYQTLSFSAATYQPYPYVQGATEADGTKPYNGQYTHGVVMAKGKFYASVVYVDTGPGPVPLEFRIWVEAQYRRM